MKIFSSKLRISVRIADEEDEDTFGDQITVLVTFPSPTAAAADPQAVVGLCARSRKPEWVESGGGKLVGGERGGRVVGGVPRPFRVLLKVVGGVPHPPGFRVLLSPFLDHFNVFCSAFEHSNPLNAHLVERYEEVNNVNKEELPRWSSRKSFRPLQRILVSIGFPVTIFYWNFYTRGVSKKMSPCSKNFKLLLLNTLILMK